MQFLWLSGTKYISQIWSYQEGHSEVKVCSGAQMFATGHISRCYIDAV